MSQLLVVHGLAVLLTLLPARKILYVRPVE